MVMTNQGDNGIKTKNRWAWGAIMTKTAMDYHDCDSQ